jgi:LmbE family N-acetylglucosaminyl deacetylase
MRNENPSTPSSTSSQIPTASDPASDLQPVPQSILVVFAHPDDESFGPAAALARYARAGSKVHGLFFTRGQHGQSTLQPAPSSEELGRLREADLRDATAAIGFAGIEVLDYEDGKLDLAPPRELEAHVQDAIERYRPEVLITFGPGGITHHPDHLAAHRAAVAAFRRAQGHGIAVQELYYDAVPPGAAAAQDLAGLPDGSPNTWIDVAGAQAIQLAALRFHARHVADAAEMVHRLEAQSRPFATLYRAFPQVMSGRQVTRFMEGVQG